MCVCVYVWKKSNGNWHYTIFLIIIFFDRLKTLGDVKIGGGLGEGIFSCCGGWRVPNGEERRRSTFDVVCLWCLGGGEEKE